MKRFKRIYIEITNVCNLNCSFCPATGRSPAFMNEKNFIMILDQVKDFSDHLYFHVKGEPLLHPQIDAFLDICREKKFMVNLATNGTLVGRNGLKLLHKPALRQVSFSLHNLADQPDPAVRLKYLEEMFSFALESMNRTAVLIEFKLWNLNSGSDRDINRQILDFIEKRLGFPDPIPQEIRTGRGIKLMDRMFLNMGTRFSWPDMKSPEGSTAGFCYGLKTQIAILVDGTVVPCCLDGEGIMNLGNIHESLFSDIINSERAKNIFNGFSNRTAVEEMCRRCTYRKRFDV